MGSAGDRAIAQSSVHLKSVSWSGFMSCQDRATRSAARGPPSQEKKRSNCAGETAGAVAIAFKMIIVAAGEVSTTTVRALAALTMLDFSSEGIARQRSVLESASKIYVHASLTTQPTLRIVRVARHVTYLMVQISEPSTKVVSNASLNITVQLHGL